MRFSNVYDDRQRAAAYARLGFPGTYYLAYRDLPDILSASVMGGPALDFGCGTGRSTRFLRGLGYETIGIDISPHMVALARGADPDGAYFVVPDGDYSQLGTQRFALIFSSFAFDNIPGADHRAGLLRSLGALLASGGRIVLLGSTPEIYWHEWASFTTAVFPENRGAPSGHRVRIIMKDVEDKRPVEDLIWYEEDYRVMFDAAGLHVVAEHRPLGREGEPQTWINETSVPPWVIYVLAARGQGTPDRRQGQTPTGD